MNPSRSCRVEKLLEQSPWRQDEDYKRQKKRELNSMELNVATAERPRKIRINLDTGAVATTLPAKMFAGTPDGRPISFRTASGQILKDEGYVELKGEDNKKMLKARVTQVRRPLARGPAVAKQNLVLINGDAGYIIPNLGVRRFAGRNRRTPKISTAPHRCELKVGSMCLTCGPMDRAILARMRWLST